MLALVDVIILLVNLGLIFPSKQVFEIIDTSLHVYTVKQLKSDEFRNNYLMFYLWTLEIKLFSIVTKDKLGCLVSLCFILTHSKCR